MPAGKLKVGVIGVGVLGRHHTRLYKESENTELIGIYDANEEVAKNISKEHFVKIFHTIDELADQCDGLSIAVPATLHHKIALPLLQKKKHLLIEKPLAATVQQAGELAALAEENNVVLEVGHTERYNPVMSFIEGKVKDIRFIEAKRLAPYPPPRPGLLPRGTEVGVVLDLMIHDLELILHLIKSKVEKVEATGMSVLSQSEDMANARITFKNGCVADVTASRISEVPMRKMQIFQSESYIILDYQDKTGVVFSKSAAGIEKEAVPVIDHNALQEELENFIRNALTAIETKKVPELKVSGKSGLEALRLAVKITEEINRHNRYYNFSQATTITENYY
jgi:predicted dehydrogenase